MSDEIVVIAPKDLTETKALSKDLAASALMPLALRKKPEDVLAIVLTGAELGLAPMQSVRGIHIINGRATLSADLMGALVKRSALCEYLQLVESSGSVATYKTKRKGEPAETSISFTIDQAKAAGLSGDNWRKYPDAMLRARALSGICRAVYPDLLLGCYDPDEIGAEEPARDVTPQAVHVESVKEAIRAQVTATPKTAIVDAEVVPTPVPAAPEPSAPAREPGADEDVRPISIEERIKTAKDAAALKALVPEIRLHAPAQLPHLRKLFDARKAELTSGPA